MKHPRSYHQEQQRKVKRMIKKLFFRRKRRKLIDAVARTVAEIKVSSVYADMTDSEKQTTAIALATLVGVELDSPVTAVAICDLVKSDLM